MAQIETAEGNEPDLKRATISQLATDDSLELHFDDHRFFTELLGQHDGNVRIIEQGLGVRIGVNGSTLKISGGHAEQALSGKILSDLYDLLKRGYPIYVGDVEYAIRILRADRNVDLKDIFLDTVYISAHKRIISPKSLNQKAYIEAIRAYDIVFGIGPAGTGKTYLAMAMALAALMKNQVTRMVLCRPAVEAGEKLGFLPGDLAEKVNPYLRPLYDALHDMVDFDRARRMVERGTIEVAPLGFMRGRAQPVTSRVLTHLGWRRIGDLEPGDYVIGSDGRPTQVLGVYPQGEKQVFGITATDGASTRCCAEHLWAVFTPHDRSRGKPARIVDVREMIGRLSCAHQHRFELPLISSPVSFPARDVQLDPYALGL